MRQLLADREWVTDGGAVGLPVALTALVGEALLLKERLNDAVAQCVGEVLGVEVAK